MEEEFVYEEHGNKIKYIRLTIGVILLIGLGLFLYKRFMFDAKDKVVYEVGDTYKEDVSAYVNNTILDKDKSCSITSSMS